MRVSGEQALTELLGKENGDADAAAAEGLRSEGFGDAPFIGAESIHGEDQEQP